MTTDFSSELAAKVLAGRPPALVGLDPRLDAFPASVAPREPPAARIAAFYREVLPVLAGQVPAVKPNIAFFEAHGAAGYGAYEDTCALARKLGLLVIGDIKRGDIGSTAAACAVEHFRHADAVTLHPYLGSDSLAPFLEHCGNGHGVFVLVRTSNPSAREFQDLAVAPGDHGGAATLAETVASAVHRWGADLGDPDGYSPVGAVVGATWPQEIARLRQLMPRAWFLLPGVGAQGASVKDVAPAFDDRGLGALVSQSRSILQSFAPDASDWLACIEAATRRFAEETGETAGL